LAQLEGANVTLRARVQELSAELQAATRAEAELRNMNDLIQRDTVPEASAPPAQLQALRCVCRGGLK
jgi:hypothetical protein